LMHQKVDALRSDVHAFWNSMNKTLSETTETLKRKNSNPLRSMELNALAKLTRSMDALRESIDKKCNGSGDSSPYLGSATDDELINELKSRKFLVGKMAEIKRDLGIAKYCPVTSEDVDKAIRYAGGNSCSEEATEYAYAILSHFAAKRGLL